MTFLSILGVFWVGAIIGAVLGAFIMSLVQINRDDEKEWGRYPKK